jgi:hypothetical protein
VVVRTVSAILILAISSACGVAGEPLAADDSIRVLSWNISEEAFVSEQEEFQSLLLWADPDVVLLDEVAPTANEEELMKSLVALHSRTDETWTINIGESGGRQRCVVASRAPQEALPEFSTIIPYPDADRRYLLEHMSNGDDAYNAFRLDVGIPVNGAIIILASPRRFDWRGSLPPGWHHVLDMGWTRDTFSVRYAGLPAVRPIGIGNALWLRSGHRTSTVGDARALWT